MPHLIIIPVIAGLIAQILKIFVRENKLKPDWKIITAYSGMPSGHAAVIISLTTIVGLEIGWSSPLFAICFILTILIIRDALGLRRYLGQHGKVLNDLVKDLGNDAVLDQKYPHLLERIGHTPMQVVVGGLIGLATSLIGYLILI